MPRGALVEVLSAFALPPSPLFIVHSSGPHTPPRVRAFVEIATENLTMLRADRETP